MVRLVIAWLQRLMQSPAEREERERAMSAVALLSGVNIDALHEAVAMIEKGRFVLTGTTALIIRGHHLSTADMDFLCEHAPGGEEDGTGSGGSSSRKIKTANGEIKVDFIYADHTRERFLTRNPDIICGVPVASVKDVLAFKAFAGRPKDLDFLVAWDRMYGSEYTQHALGLSTHGLFKSEAT